jgi:hypothetical protein
VVRRRGEGDGEPEGFELADVAAGLAAGVDAAGLIARAEVVVAGGGVGEQLPADHEDGAPTPKKTWPRSRLRQPLGG